jgi:S-disulfanyl-L-cysteine oxidoreductase SoxD
MIARAAYPVAALLAGAMLLSAPSGLAQGRGTAGGRYTAEQADGGARVYAIHCAMCHGRRLEGRTEIPALTGRFVAHWAGRPLADLFGYVSQAMPQHAPASLSPDQNAQLVAFLLQENGAPPGEAPLSTDPRVLSRINFDAPGPRN